MSKLIRVNGFEMATLGHINQGLWTLPNNKRTQYHRIQYWIELARTLERGLFDAVFLADVVGTYATYKQSRDTAVRSGVQVPNLAPTLVIGAMAAVTKHLGFAATVTTTYEPPFGWARRLSTLDHITGGRFAWNVVTGYLPDAAKNFGLNEQIKHDDRYELAEEFLEVLYHLFESSWDSDAVVQDAARGIYTDPARVHEIAFEGEYFHVAGPHLSEPSPQRTPVIYQAGTSDRGKRFAARHAEGTFLSPRDEDSAAADIADLRRLAVQEGRKAQDIKAFLSVEVVTGNSQEEVDAKVQTLVRHRDIEGHLAAFGGWSGIDLAGEDTDKFLEYTAGDAIQSWEKRWTHGEGRKSVGEILEYVSHPAHNRFFVAGTPDRVADRLEEIIDRTDADGFNLVQHLSPGTFEDFTDLIVPELQKRGRYRTAYTEGETLRERLYGDGNPFAHKGHPAAKIAAQREQRTQQRIQEEARQRIQEEASRQVDGTYGRLRRSA